MNRRSITAIFLSLILGTGCYFVLPVIITTGMVAFPGTISGAAGTYNQLDDSGSFVIDGIIRDQDGEPVAGLDIELRNSNSDLLDSDISDSDGRYHVSHVVTGSVDREMRDEISTFDLGGAYPNPLGIDSREEPGVTRLPFRITDEGSYQIEVYTIDGRLVTRSEERLSSGEHTVRVRLPGTAGTYLIRVRGEGVQEVRTVTSLSGTGTGASVSVSSGSTVTMQQANSESGTIASDNEEVTLKVHGGSSFNDYTTTFTVPGEYTYDVTLESLSIQELCEDLQLATNSSRPGNWIDVEGMDDHFGDEPLAWYYDSSADANEEETRHPVLIDTGEDDAENSDEDMIPRLLVPLHPADYMGGGNGELVIISEDESIQCSGIELEVEPLEPAPGTMVQMVDDMESALVSRAHAFGFSEEELMNTSLDDLPDLLVPMAAGLRAINDPDNPENLRAVITGEALSPDDTETIEEIIGVLDAVLAESGGAALFQALSEDFGNIEEVPESVQKSLQKSIGIDHRIQAFSTDLDEPSDLEFWLNQHSRCATFNDYKVGDVAGVAAAAVGFIPGAQGIAAGATTVISITQLMVNLCEGQLPSQLEDIFLIASITDFNEDSEDEGEWHAQLEATSEGFTFGIPDALGLVPAGQMLTKFVRGFQGQLSEVQVLGGYFLEYLESLVKGAFELPGDSDFITFDPVTWGPVVVDPNRDNEEEYFSWNFILLDAGSDYPVVFTAEDESKYEVNAVGISELLVRTQEGAFQDLLSVSQNRPEIEVKAIEVEIQTLDHTAAPTSMYMDPEIETELYLQADIKNADDKSVRWTLAVEEGPSPISFEPMGVDNEYLKFEIPAIPDDGDPYEARYLIHAISEAEGGLRETGEPVRDDYVFIWVQAEEEEEEENLFHLNPRPGCLTLDESFTLSAIYGEETVSFNEMNVTMDGPGSISGSGVYTASGDGIVSITASYYDSGLEMTFTDEIEFLVMDECGELVVESDYFTYFSDCAGADFVSFDNIMSFSLLEANFGFESGADIIVNLQTDIRDSGTWTRELFWPDPDSPGETEWHVPTFYDSSGDLWLEDEGALDGQTQYKIEITRSEIMFEGQTIGIFSGNFAIPMYNEDEFQREDLYWDERTTSMIYGTFTDIPYVPGFDFCGTPVTDEEDPAEDDITSSVSN